MIKNIKKRMAIFMAVVIVVTTFLVPNTRDIYADDEITINNEATTTSPKIIDMDKVYKDKKIIITFPHLLYDKGKNQITKDNYKQNIEKIKKILSLKERKYDKAETDELSNDTPLLDSFQKHIKDENITFEITNDNKTKITINNIDENVIPKGGEYAFSINSNQILYKDTSKTLFSTTFFLNTIYPDFTDENGEKITKLNYLPNQDIKLNFNFDMNDNRNIFFKKDSAYFYITSKTPNDFLNKLGNAITFSKDATKTSSSSIIKQISSTNSNIEIKGLDNKKPYILIKKEFWKSNEAADDIKNAKSIIIKKDAFGLKNKTNFPSKDIIIPVDFSNEKMPLINSVKIGTTTKSSLNEKINFENVKLDSNITIELNQEVEKKDTNTKLSDIIKIKKNDEDIALDLIFNKGYIFPLEKFSKIDLTLNNDIKLEENTKYTLTIDKTKLKSGSKNLTEEESFSFTTITLPKKEDLPNLSKDFNPNIMGGQNTFIIPFDKDISNYDIDNDKIKIIKTEDGKKEELKINNGIEKIEKDEKNLIITLNDKLSSAFKYNLNFEKGFLKDNKTNAELGPINREITIKKSEKVNYNEVKNKKNIRTNDKFIIIEYKEPLTEDIEIDKDKIKLTKTDETPEKNIEIEKIEKIENTPTKKSEKKVLNSIKLTLKNPLEKGKYKLLLDELFLYTKNTDPHESRTVEGTVSSDFEVSDEKIPEYNKENQVPTLYSDKNETLTLPFTENLDRYEFQENKLKIVGESIKKEKIEKEIKKDQVEKINNELKIKINSGEIPDGKYKIVAENGVLKSSTNEVKAFETNSFSVINEKNEKIEKEKQKQEQDKKKQDLAKKQEEERKRKAEEAKKKAKEEREKREKEEKNQREKIFKETLLDKLTEEIDKRLKKENDVRNKPSKKEIRDKLVRNDYITDYINSYGEDYSFIEDFVNRYAGFAYGASHNNPFLDRSHHIYPHNKGYYDYYNYYDYGYRFPTQREGLDMKSQEMMELENELKSKEKELIAMERELNNRNKINKNAYSLPLNSSINNRIEITVGMPYALEYDGNDNPTRIDLGTPTYIANGRTMVPISKIASAIGASVDYDDKTKNITVSKPGTTAIFNPRTSYVYINGIAENMGIRPTVQNKRILVPLHYLGKTIGLTNGQGIIYDADTKKIIIKNY